MDRGTLACGKYQMRQTYFTDCSAFSDQLANRGTILDRSAADI